MKRINFRKRSTSHRLPYKGNYKLYPFEIPNIRWAREVGKSPSRLAEIYGVSSCHISNICAYRRWK